jgi:WD40 repeat protein
MRSHWSNSNGKRSHEISGLWEVRMDVQTCECANTLQGHESWVHSVAFSPDNQTLVSGGSDLTVRLWDIKRGNFLKVLPGHTKMITRVQFSPLCDTAASASYDLTIKLWDCKTGKCLNTIPDHKNWILGIAFHPHGKILASASQDQTVRFWDVETGNCQKVMRSPRPYEGMNITRIAGLTTAQKETLKALGAFQNPQLPNKTAQRFLSGDVAIRA